MKTLVKFEVGDVVRQKHDTYANRTMSGTPNRTVVSLTENPDVIVVFDPMTQRLVNAFVWAHVLVHKATTVTLHEALRLRSGEFPRGGARPVWD